MPLNLRQMIDASNVLAGGPGSGRHPELGGFQKISSSLDRFGKSTSYSAKSGQTVSIHEKPNSMHQITHTDGGQTSHSSAHSASLMMKGRYGIQHEFEPRFGKKQSA